MNFDVFNSIGKQFDVQQLLIANNVNGTAKMVDISLDTKNLNHSITMLAPKNY